MRGLALWNCVIIDSDFDFKQLAIDNSGWGMDFQFVDHGHFTDIAIECNLQ